MKLVVATESSTLMRCWRASLLASPTVVPASTEPCRWIAPVRARIASSSVVLPLWNGPTSAMHRGPLGLVPFCPISTSLVRPGSWTYYPALKDIVSGKAGAGKPLVCRGRTGVRWLARGGRRRAGDFLDEIAQAFLLTLLRSQFLPADRMLSYQRGLLEQLLRHARAQVPFYRDSGRL